VVSGQARRQARFDVMTTELRWAGRSVRSSVEGVAEVAQGHQVAADRRHGKSDCEPVSDPSLGQITQPRLGDRRELQGSLRVFRMPDLGELPLVERVLTLPPGAVQQDVHLHPAQRKTVAE